MVMRMLEVGGISPLTDDLRTADDDNPNGYYEFERVKKLNQGDTAWLSKARGKAIKVVAPLLLKLPSMYEYRVLFMRRKTEEILASQARMLEHRGEQKKVDDNTLAVLFQQHIENIQTWMSNQSNFRCLVVDYNAMFTNSGHQIDQMKGFLGGQLNGDAMVAVCDPGLYHQRHSTLPLQPSRIV